MNPLHDDKARGKDEQPGKAKSSRVEHLRWLLGDDVLLLPWPLGSKGTRARWGHLTVAAMANPKHLAKLEAGNIGVAQGQVSNGLCSIDLDDDEWMHRFLEANPSLADSLRTRGARGGNIWLRCVGSYPGTFKIKTDDGAEVGEWRANGAQTIISGRHPSGCEYTLTVGEPPLRIAFESIVWPEGLRAPKAKTAETSELPIVHRNTATQSHSHAETQETHAGASRLGSADFFDISRFVPNTRHTSDRLLFAMSGALLTWEKQQDRKATAGEKQAIFRQWWKLAKLHVDPAMDEAAYLSKWLNACKRRKCASDETRLQSAWKAAQTEPLPPEASAIYDPPMSEKMQMLVALCYQLQRIQADRPFFLACRDAGSLLEVPFTTVHCWLQILAESDGPYCILKKVSTGSQPARRANEYSYLHTLTNR